MLSFVCSLKMPSKSLADAASPSAAALGVRKSLADAASPSAAALGVRVRELEKFKMRRSSSVPANSTSNSVFKRVASQLPPSLNFRGELLDVHKRRSVPNLKRIQLDHETRSLYDPEAPSRLATDGMVPWNHRTGYGNISEIDDETSRAPLPKERIRDVLELKHGVSGFAASGDADEVRRLLAALDACQDSLEPPIGPILAAVKSAKATETKTMMKRLAKATVAIASMQSMRVGTSAHPCCISSSAQPW